MDLNVGIKGDYCMFTSFPDIQQPLYLNALKLCQILTCHPWVQTSLGPDPNFLWTTSGRTKEMLDLFFYLGAMAM